ncbi:MAG: hypothetical protein MJE66_21215, partial [Proteobacteria bacterium]|nr:hypothetical protein [Pseudomonadota bacterium]
MPQTGQSRSDRQGRGLRSFRALARFVRDGVALCCGGEIVWANPRLCEWFEASGLRVGGELASLFEDDRGRALDLSRGGPCVGRLRGGTGRRVRLERVDAANDEDAVAEEVWVIEELEQRDTLEAEVLSASRALHAANRELVALRERSREEASEREDLLTVVSHELRTPVTVILGYNKLLLSEQVGMLSEDQRRFLEESTKSCQRLNTFIENLL